MPFSEMQLEFFRNAHKRWNVKTGATRSGKTFMDLYLIPKRIRAVAGLPGDIVFLGNTKETLRANIIQPMQDIWGTRLVSDISSDNYAKVFGERVRCIGASKITANDRLRGSSIKYCYGDEVCTWHPLPFTMLKSRLDKSYSKCDLTCNPEGKLHWFKQFIDSGPDMFCQKYTIDDNPFNDPGFVENLKREYAGTVYYDRYIKGEWVNAEGLVYSMFDDERHVTNEEFEMSPVYFLGCDYGTQNATVYLLWHRLKDGRWLCEKEYYYSGRTEIRQKTDEQYCDDLITFLNGVKLNGMVVDPSAASFIAALRKRGISVITAKNSVNDGIRYTASLLNKDQLLFRPCCKHTIEEFQLYSWKIPNPGQIMAQDEVIKENDHCMDAMRYFCYTILAVNKVGTSRLRG